MSTKNQLSNYQLALIHTAKAFYDRNYRIQYADTRFTHKDITDIMQIDYRWESSLNDSSLIKHPEDYTSKDLGYTNCADFTHDVYQSALNYEIGLNTTYNLMQEIKNSDSKTSVCYYEITGNESEEVRRQIEEEFTKKLQVGDIIVNRYRGNRRGGGHAILYVGNSLKLPDNSDVIHSTGKIYDYSLMKEGYEEFGTVELLKVEDLFNKEHPRYFFETSYQIGIIRPLNVFNGEIPQQTKNRLKNLKNILAEKVASQSLGQTVSVGDKITYTFNITNLSSRKRRIEIKDIIPTNASYLEGACFTYNNKKLKSTFILGKGETKSVSYTIIVNSESKVESKKATVNGVLARCKDIFVRNTLSEIEKSYIHKYINNLEQGKNNSYKGVSLVNDMYNQLFNKNVFGEDSERKVLSSVFKNCTRIKSYNALEINENSKYFNMIAPGLYGGRNVASSTLFNKYRTRLLDKNQLIVGDIIIALENEKDFIIKTYLFLGEETYEITNGLTKLKSVEILEKFIAYSTFVVIRP